MASSHVNQNATRFQDSATFEHRPLMLLKDFLRDDSFHSCSSSSNGFHMYPRKSKVQQLPPKSNKPSMVLLRTRSRKAAATTISAVHKLINVVKFIPFASVKSSLALSRGSKSTRSNVRNNNVSSEKVKVKDILRWKSFRDLMEERSTATDTDTATATTTTTTSCSRRSSWCDSDFTSSEDYLSPWCGENEEFLGRKSLVGKHGTNVTLLRNPKDRGYSFEESEQQSPVSVLESTFGDNEGYFSPFHRSFSNNTKSKRCLVTQRVEEFDVFSSGESTIFEEEEKMDAIAAKASMLLSRVEELTSVDITSKSKLNDYHLLMDLIVPALSANVDLNDGEFDNEILGKVKLWMKGECDESYEWELEAKRDVYIRDMEKGVQWKKFRQEEDEISKELEIKVLNELIDEVLNDLIN